MIASAQTFARVAICFVLLLAACERSNPPQPASEQTQTKATQLRIVTLAPALSKMIVDLGKGNLIVGVTDFDDLATRGTPSVGPFMDVNTEALYAAHPTHVLMMAGQGGVPDTLKAMQAKMGFKLYSWTYPDNITDIANILFDDREGKSNLGTILNVPAEAAAIRDRFLLQLDNVRRAVESDKKPSTLLVISVEGSVMASGPGSVLDSLMAYVGATNAATEANSAPVFDREKLLSARPQVILLMLPNQPPLEDFQTDPRLALFRGLDIPAVKNKRIVLINDSSVHLPATNLPQLAAKMALAIHPDLSGQIEKALTQSPATQAYHP